MVARGMATEVEEVTAHRLSRQDQYTPVTRSRPVDENRTGDNGPIGPCATPIKKDDPRQGGEEARVVVYQPRGVGLMHSRPEAE